MAQKKILTVVGMSCGACQKIIEKRLAAIEGVQKVTVHLNEGKVEVEMLSDIPNEHFHKALEGTHYQITHLQP